ncbi:MAG: pyridoxamine 5'-phosphate oxidase family protein [Methanobacteriaceae archaeon]|nr:pyridoxamine 5'-phosphate oxidase family protein [Methanobacteriaceae archaeon]
MSLYKVPLIKKNEYDSIIKNNFISRIAFTGEYPYIAPFLYVFQDNHLYFLSTKYGKKIKRLEKNPRVAVEIEEYNDDLSNYQFVTLQGQIIEEESPEKRKEVRQLFANLIESQGLSRNILAALGHSPEDPLACLVQKECSYVWKLVNVQSIIGIKKAE